MFQIGDRVKINGHHIGDDFGGEAIFRGNSTTHSDCVALERLDGVKGKAQNGWWNFRYIDLIYLELISSGETISQKTNIMQTLTAKIKRIFSPSLQKQYKAGLIDNCGELTSKGKEEVDMLVRDLVDQQLVERAEEIIKEEKENK